MDSADNVADEEIHRIGRGRSADLDLICFRCGKSALPVEQHGHFVAVFVQHREIIPTVLVVVPGLELGRR